MNSLTGHGIGTMKNWWNGVTLLSPLTVPRRLYVMWCRTAWANIYGWRPQRWPCPNVASAGGSLVCTSHHLSTNCGIATLLKYGNSRTSKWKTDIHGWRNSTGFPTILQGWPFSRIPSTLATTNFLSWLIMIEREQKRSITLGPKRGRRSRFRF